MLGRVVKAGRIESGWTRPELAAEAGVPTETVDAVEGCRTDVSVGELTRVLKALDLAVHFDPADGMSVRAVVHPKLVAELERLAGMGMFGRDPGDVAARFIEAGARDVFGMAMRLDTRGQAVLEHRVRKGRA